VGSLLREVRYVLLENRVGLAGLSIIVFFTLMAVLADWIAPYNPYELVGPPYTPPNERFILGTNDIGQDIFSEFIYGSRVSLYVGLTAPLISSAVGTVLGLLSGYLGGFVDELVVGAVDVMLALPSLPLIIILAAYLGPSLNNIIIVLAVFGWPGFTRIVRSQVLSLRERPYVEAARAAGAGSLRIMFRHILPHVVPLVIAHVILSATSAILTEAGLSFLGLGDPTVKSWGQILRRAQVGHALHQGLWLWVFVPGLAIALLGAGFTLLGIAIEERVNPRLRRTRV
jgi:ABC-type dipeptide/oligopeptide/nickel transport system permease subunit